MSELTATAIACPNIAFIKYWGNRDEALRLPSNGSISMNLGWLKTRTRVSFKTGYSEDCLFINTQPETGAGLDRMRRFLDIVRQMAGIDLHAHVTSENDYPTGAGIASSAAAYAAMAVAASNALGLSLDESQLSRLARLGSGSACRSIPSGFVEWRPSENDRDSYAFSIASPDHWDLVDCIALVNADHKAIGSTEGHARAVTSPLQETRVAGAPKRLDECRSALLTRDFDALAAVVELDSNLMHAVMITSSPPLLYWAPATVEIMRSVPVWRAEGIPACYTIDAGPNVHVICLSSYAGPVQARLNAIPGVSKVIVSPPGGGAEVEQAPTQ